MNATIKIDMDTITRKRGNNREMAEAVMAATRAAMLSEHAGYYARHRRDGEGYSHFADGSFQWETSAGNVFRIERDGETLIINVSGFRHGIPWRFFGMGAEFCGFKPLDLLEESTWEAESQAPDLEPWLTVGDRRPNDWKWLRRAGERGTALVMITDDARREAEDRWPDAEYWDADAFSRGELDTQGFSIVIESFPESYQGIRRMMEADTVEFWNGIAVKGHGQFSGFWHSLSDLRSELKRFYAHIAMLKWTVQWERWGRGEPWEPHPTVPEDSAFFSDNGATFHVAGRTPLIVDDATPHNRRLIAIVAMHECFRAFRKTAIKADAAKWHETATDWFVWGGLS